MGHGDQKVLGARDRGGGARAGGGAASGAPSPPRPPALNDRAAGDLG